MSREITVDDRAVAELEAALAWYGEQRFELGEALYAEIELVLRKLAEDRVVDMRAPDVADRLRVYRARLDRFPYWVVYQRCGETIVVIALAHVRREPGYWLKRADGR
jgi:hypothetical protein